MEESHRVLPAVTVLQTLPYSATVLISVPVPDAHLTMLKTEVDAGVLHIGYGEYIQAVTISKTETLTVVHSEFTGDKLIVEVALSGGIKQ